MNKNRTIRTASAALFAIIGIVLVMGVASADEGECGNTVTTDNTVAVDTYYPTIQSPGIYTASQGDSITFSWDSANYGPSHSTAITLTVYKRDGNLNWIEKNSNSWTLSPSNSMTAVSGSISVDYDFQRYKIVFEASQNGNQDSADCYFAATPSGIYDNRFVGYMEAYDDSNSANDYILVTPTNPNSNDPLMLNSENGIVWIWAEWYVKGETDMTKTNFEVSITVYSRMLGSSSWGSSTSSADDEWEEYAIFPLVYGGEHRNWLNIDDESFYNNQIREYKFVMEISMWNTSGETSSGTGTCYGITIPGVG